MEYHALEQLCGVHHSIDGRYLGRTSGDVNLRLEDLLRCDCRLLRSGDIRLRSIALLSDVSGFSAGS